MPSTSQNVKLCQEYATQRRKLIVTFFVGFSSTALLTNFLATWLVISYGIVCFVGVLIYSLFLGFGTDSERNYFGRHRKDGGEDLRYTKHVSYEDHQTFKGHRINDIKKLLKQLKKK